MAIDIKKILGKLGLKTTRGKNGKKELNIQSEKYKYVSTMRLISIFTIAILVTILAGTMFFVYTSIVSTLGQVQSIALYQSQLRIELIDFARLEKIEKKWNEKFDTTELNIERNPFLKTIIPPEDKP